MYSKYESEIAEMKESRAVMDRRVSALCMDMEDTRVSTTASVKTVELSIRTLE